MTSRTDRLYGIVEALRASAPEACTAGQLALRFDVSTRTIERDVVSLQETGLPIASAPGPHGGYTMATDHPLPPLNLSPGEAVAIAIALADADGPYADASRSARRKVMAAMAASDPAAARRLANPEVQVLRSAISRREVVELRYRGLDGTVAIRQVEPMALTTRERLWYLAGWCRTTEAYRTFRLERIEETTPTGEISPEREGRPPFEDQPHLFD